MTFVSDLRVKAARERAWLIGDSVWMRQWLLDQAHRASSSALEFKSGYAARCREIALRFGRAPSAKVGNSHWETEPRIPAGNNILSGRWTRLAGDVPSPDDLPDTPEQRPTTSQERNRIGKGLAKYGKRPGAQEAVMALLEALPWLEELAASVISYWDGPKSLEELQSAAQSPSKGYDLHQYCGADRRGKRWISAFKDRWVGQCCAYPPLEAS